MAMVVRSIGYACARKEVENHKLVHFVFPAVMRFYDITNQLINQSTN